MRDTILPIVLTCIFLIGALAAACTKPAEQTIKIGVIIPLTGNSAIYGDWGKKALDIAKDEVNQNGGVRGRPIELSYEDGKMLAPDSVSAFKKLVDDDNVRYVLTVGSGPAVAVSPLANENRVIQMDFSATTSKYSTENDYTFRTALKATQFGTDGAQLLKNEPFNAKNVAVLFINNEQGQDINSRFKQAAKTQGLQIGATEMFDQDSTDFRTQVLKIKEADPDWIFLISHVKEAGQIVKQMNELGLTTPILSHVFSIEGDPFFEGAGKDFKNKIIYMAPKYDPDNPSALIKKYNEEYARRYGKPSEYFGAFGYDGLKVLASAMENCIDPVDTDCVKDRLFETKNFPGLTGNITFDKYGDTNKELMLKTIRDGSYAPFS